MLATVLKICIIHHLVAVAIAVNGGGRCFHPDKSVKTLVSMSTKDHEGAFPVNTIATYKCDHGYVILNDESRRCLDNGTWSGIEPYCGINVANTGEIQNFNGQYSGNLDDILKGFYEDCVRINSSKAALNIELSRTHVIDLVEFVFEDPIILLQHKVPKVFYSLTHDMVSHKSQDFTMLEVNKNYSKVVKENSYAVFQYAVPRPSPSNSIYLEIEWRDVEAGFGLCDIALYSRSGPPTSCGTPDQRNGTLMELVEGRSATYRCPKRFHLVGNSVRYCSNGRWLAEAPTCKYGNSDSSRVTTSSLLTGFLIFTGLELAYDGRIF